MIQRFKQFETVQYNNTVETFFKSINTIGYSNPHVFNEFILLDSVGLEFKLYEDVMYITSIKSYDIRKEKIYQSFKTIIDIANNSNLTLGINPFPFKESNMNSNELNNMYSSLNFKLINGKWIKQPV